MHSMIVKAYLFAMYAHGEQVRKDGLPYIIHPVEVAMELARNGADENLICAGFLHDTIEDAFITREQLVASFNDEIADLVVADSENKEDSWEKRKSDALDVLRQPGDRDHKMLMCADKLSNMRSLREGLDTQGEEVWNRFHRGRDKQAWLFHETVKALEPLEGLPMYEELKQMTHEVFDTDVPQNQEPNV
jgi:(p)ppGpp synthase/HD superfamily hydrolase